MSILDRLYGGLKILPETAKPAELVKGRKSYPKTGKGKSALRISSGTVAEDFLTNLRGLKGIQTYREMSKNDPIIGGILGQIDLQLRSVTWNIKPGDTSTESLILTKLVKDSIERLERPWTFVMSDFATMLTYGWSLFETLYDERDGQIVLSDLPFRAQDTLDKWIFDETGIATDMIQRVPNTMQIYEIPLRNCFHLTTNGRKNNPEGDSILRTCYRPWFIKKTIEEIEGIGIERDLTGIPHLHFTHEEFDPDAQENAAIVNWAEDLVTSIAKDAQSGIITYEGMELSLLKASTPSIDTDKVIRRYNQAIAIALSSQVMVIAFETRGSATTANAYGDMMLDALDSWSEIIVRLFQYQIVNRLKIFNGLEKANVTITPSKISQRDKTEFAAFISRLIKNGAITPDDTLEEFIRMENELPAMDPETARLVGDLAQAAKTVEVRNGELIECDEDGVVPKTGPKNYMISVRNLPIVIKAFKNNEDAIAAAQSYQRLGTVTLSKSIGARNKNEVFTKLITLY